ncbi:MAG: hypothetical protein ABIC36_02450 [bacterium]
MAITIENTITVEHIDNYHREADFTIIVGENILLKFVPDRSILKERPKLENIINIPDLVISKELGWVKKIARISSNLKTSLGDYVSNWDSGKTDSLQDKKEQISKDSLEIATIERNLGFSLSDPHSLAFCMGENGCGAYVGEMDTLTIFCHQCKKELEEKDYITVNYLDKKITGFLDGGIWFEDYVEKLLKDEGWRVWTHGSVMGASGILHPIDLLAIKEGKVLIMECKTGKVSSRDISHFIVQKIDISSHFGFFLSVRECSSKNTAVLFSASTSCLIDNIENKSEKDLIEMIRKHLYKFIDKEEKNINLPMKLPNELGVEKPD